MDQMKTHAQTSAGPDDETRTLTRDLADLCKRDAAAFARLVREADAVQRQGGDRHAWLLQRLAGLA
jgi:hypothetical protein